MISPPVNTWVKVKSIDCTFTVSVTRTGADELRLPAASYAARWFGRESIARTQFIKKLWDYIKAENLQDSVNKRNINADAKLLPVFGKAQVSMFELAGIVGKHLS